MDFFIGKMGAYTRSLSLKAKWENKVSSGDLTSKELTPTQKKNEDFKRAYAEMKRLEDGADQTLTEIRTKYEYGKKLTPDEINYLKNHDPQMYQQVCRTELEKKQYARELENCRTKEEVQNLRVEKANASLVRMKSVSDNPNISEADKLAFAVQEQQRLDALNRIALKFVQSGEYEKLPTEEEMQKAENDLRDAERAEQELRTDAPVKTTPEDSGQNRTEEESDTPTRIEAEQTPEAEKLRRAKAKAGYQQNTLSAYESDPICFSEL